MVELSSWLPDQFVEEYSLSVICPLSVYLHSPQCNRCRLFSPSLFLSLSFWSGVCVLGWVGSGCRAWEKLAMWDSDFTVWISSLTHSRWAPGQLLAARMWAGIFPAALCSSVKGVNTTQPAELSQDACEDRGGKGTIREGSNQCLAHSRCPASV